MPRSFYLDYLQRNTHGDHRRSRPNTSTHSLPITPDDLPKPRLEGIIAPRQIIEISNLHPFARGTARHPTEAIVTRTPSSKPEQLGQRQHAIQREWRKMAGNKTPPC